MHEYHIMETIVKTAKEAAEKAGATKVTRVSLVVGKLTGFEEGSIRLYFETLSKGTPLEGARLAIRYVEPKLKCETCQSCFDYQAQIFLCPVCGRPGSPTGIGKEFYIEDIEIESA